ncbi:hypothetical protein ACFTZB_42915 [Rhodococcus sp. NPDC057014]
MTTAGEYFHVQGPLNVPLGPQWYPLIAQAGGPSRASTSPAGTPT